MAGYDIGAPPAASAHGSVSGSEGRRGSGSSADSGAMNLLGNDLVSQLVNMADFDDIDDDA